MYMEKIPVFISISTPPYHKNIEDTINLIYRLIDNYKIDGFSFLRKTLGITALSHLKGFIHITKAVKKAFGGIVIGFPRDLYKEANNEIETPTLWNHIEGSMIYLSEKPMLIIRDRRIEDDNGIFDINNISEDKLSSGLIQYITIDFQDNKNIQKLESDLNTNIKQFLSKVYSTYNAQTRKIPIYLSCPSKKHRNDKQELFFQRLIELLSEKNVYLTNSDELGFEAIRSSLEKSNGAIIFGLTQIQILEFILRKGIKNREKLMKNFNFSSIWNDIEGAMAYQEGLPLLILKERALYKYNNEENQSEIFFNGIFDESNHQFRIIEIDLDNFNEKELKMYINEWLDSVKEYTLLKYYQK